MILDEEKNENICLVKKYTIKRGKNLFGICKNKKQKEGEMKKKNNNNYMNQIKTRNKIIVHLCYFLIA